MNADRPKRRSRVPAGRLERLARFGLMAGELAAGSLVAGVRRVAGAGPADAASAVLSGANARRLARRLSQLRGAAMKLGQLLSLEGADVLPPEFAEALAVLRAAADTMPASQVRRVLGREYGKGWEARFRELDLEPLAAASIGQVHAATTLDGRRLALKIQYPGVARSIESDVNNVAALLRMARLLPVELDVSGIVAEAKRQLGQEADYLCEAASLRRYAGLVADEPAFFVPRVHDDLTTRRILAMDLVEGRPLESLAATGVTHERRDAAGRLLERLVFRELFEFRFMQTDPNFANYLLEEVGGRETGRIALLDFGSAREFPAEFTARYARICRAIVAGEREAVRQAAVEIGYLDAAEKPDRARGVVDLILLVCEPLRHRGVYLHRKLVGSFLLCARIGARVDVQSLITPFLAP
jgi:predicted unusual protein kinase regulating ubiquinone biosynthesis (AarF/ABC1/UbiB family)